MERLAGRIMLLWGWPRILIAFLAGAVGALTQPPFGFFAAFFVSFTLFVWLMDGTTGKADAGLFSRFRAAFVLGWIFGFGYFVASLWWLGNALLVDADEFAWALPLAVLGLPAYLTLFWGLAALIARILWSDGFGRLAALGFAFGLAEWLRGFVLTGFPWNAIGYGVMPMPLMMQSTGPIGIFGVSALAVFVCGAPALIGTRRGMVPGLVIAALLFCGDLGYGAWKLSKADAEVASIATDGIRVRIVQPVIDQSRKLDDQERTSIFEEHLALSALPPQPDAPAAGKDAKAVAKEEPKRPDVIVWPETSIPFILTDNPDALQRIADVLKDGQVLITGAVRAEASGPGSPPRYYNSIYVIDSHGQIIGASDKVHLVPFGEYVPYEDLLSSLGITDAIAMPGGFTAAATRSLLTLPGGKSLYPLICYEAIFPDEIEDSVERSAALLNVTNDGWFGDTPGPHQHFQEARLRAVETGRWLIRDANTGISGFVDPFGRLVKGLTYNQKGVIDATVGGGAVAHFSDASRRNYFWLLMAALFAIACVTRAGFKFGSN